MPVLIILVLSLFLMPFCQSLQKGEPNPNIPDDFPSSPAEDSFRIMGGLQADFGQYPFYARVIARKNLCGGTILSPTEVLTASHCIYKDGWLDAAEIECRTGDYTKDREDESSHAQVHTVSEYRYFKEYNGRTKNGYDMVILIVNPKIEFDRFRIPFDNICKDPPSKRTKRPLKAVGLGKIGEESAVRLMEVQLTEVNDEECRRFFKGTAPQGSEVCVKTLGNKDTCVGDSGGPLFIIDPQNKRPVCLYGVTSYGPGGKPCGTYSPTVYARVTFYLDKLRSQSVAKMENSLSWKLTFEYNLLNLICILLTVWFLPKH